MGRNIDEKGYNPIYPNQAVYTLATFFASAAVMLVIQLFMYAVSGSRIELILFGRKTKRHRGRCSALNYS